MLNKAVYVGGHEVPAGAECYCVTAHKPAYAHVFPFFFPDDYMIYLCPNTYHQVKTLLSMSDKLGEGKGYLPYYDLPRFSTVVKRLAKVYLHVERDGITTEQALAAEKLNRHKRRN